MITDDLPLLRSHIGKMGRVFKILLSLITLLELALLARGLALFNLERLKLRLYLYSYAFLSGTSLITLIAFIRFADREEHLKKMVATAYIYAFCFIMWSAVVTCIDCYADGDSGIMVYVMTCIAVGVLTLIRPWVYIAYLGFSGTFLLLFTAWVREWEPYSSGFYLNFAIFLATAIFINTHNYSLSRREYVARQTLKTLSYTDQLTGVYNRRRLDKLLLTRTEQHQSFPFVVLDVDIFKQVNDTYGHPMGDTCLVRVAQILTAHFGDQVYRLGGDEFAIISSFDVAETCSRIDAINRELETAVEHIPLHISAGIYSTNASDQPTSVFSKADHALYQAKRSGSAKWMLYQETE